jgi:hypothetical protein
MGMHIQFQLILELKSLGEVECHSIILMRLKQL